MRQTISTAELGHKVQLCTMNDVITDGNISLRREAKMDRWACIKVKRKQNFGPSGVVLNESRDRPSHEVYIRYSEDTQVTNAAWVYEERGGSPPRWFKILDVADMHDANRTHFLCMACRLVEQGDTIAQPTEEKPDLSNVHYEPQTVEL